MTITTYFIAGFIGCILTGISKRKNFKTLKNYLIVLYVLAGLMFGIFTFALGITCILEDIFRTPIINSKNNMREEIDLNSFKQIIQAILNKTIDYGRDKEYYLFLTEDRDLYFLKRNEDTPEDGFDNEYSGEEIWRASCVDWDTYEMFMKVIEIESNC